MMTLGDSMAMFASEVILGKGKLSKPKPINRLSLGIQEKTKGEIYVGNVNIGKNVLNIDMEIKNRNI